LFLPASISWQNEMVSTLVGILLGFSCAAVSNALCKTYLMRAPWRHMGAMIAGGMLAQAFPKIKQATAEENFRLEKQYREFYGAPTNPLLVQAPFAGGKIPGEGEASS